jgi:serine/threonine protein kinase
VRDGELRPEEEADAELDQLVEEFVVRYRRGEHELLADLARRRPELASRIRDLLPAVAFIEEARTAGAATSDQEAAAAQQVVPPSMPERIGEYRLLREIGRGGMGVVYEAEQVSLGRHVALKVLPFHQLLDGKRLERFHREARAAALLQHPNIVPVHGVGEEGGLQYYVMQFVAGQGLDQVIREVSELKASDAPGRQESSTARMLLGGGAGTPGRSASAYHQSVARLGIQAAEALAYAHDQGILHRDIKPSNLLLDLRGNLWVTDFGLAKAEGSDDLTSSGEILGTLRYMAPEGVRGWTDPRSDIYSLGVTLYEMLALRPAFEAADRARLVRKVLDEDPPPLRRVDAAIPRDLETVVVTAMSKEPAARYGDAAALAADLRRFLAREPIHARRETTWERGVKWVRRRPAVAALIALSVLSAAGLVAGSLGHAARVELEGRKRALVYERAEEPLGEILASMVQGRFTNPLESSEAMIGFLEPVLGFFAGGGSGGGAAAEDGTPAAAPVATRLARARAYRLLSGAYEERGDLEKAAASLESADRALGDLDDAESAGLAGAGETFRREKGTVLATLRLILEQLGRTREAEEAFERLARLSPEPPRFRFRLAGKVPIGRKPQCLAAVDLDGDGAPDLAAALGGTSAVGVAWGRGAFEFEPPAELAVESAPFAVAAADMDGDGDLDLLATNRLTGSLSLLRNEGRRAFAPSVHHPIGEKAFGLDARDLDGDDDLDVAVVAGGIERIALLWNQGGGLLGAPELLEVTAYPNHIALEDLDGDGDADLALASSGRAQRENAGGIDVLWNEGGRSFRRTGPHAAGQGPATVLPLDLDRDGRADLVAANHVARTLAFLKGTGERGFEAPFLFPSGHGPYALAAADFDGDGDQDFAVAHYSSHDVLAFPNDGSGRPGLPLHFAVGPQPFGLAAADLDRDGRPDLAVPSERAGEVWLLRNEPVEWEGR